MTKEGKREKGAEKGVGWGRAKGGEKVEGISEGKRGRAKRGEKGKG